MKFSILPRVAVKNRCDCVQNGIKIYWPMAMLDRWPLKTVKIK